MDKQIRTIVTLLVAGLSMLACSVKDDVLQPQTGVLSLTTSIEPFEGEDVTKTNMAGNAFAVGDRMKLKIICPFSDHTEFGETTYGDTADALWIMKWTGSGWTYLTKDDKVDVGSQYAYTYSRNLYGEREAQQTPYVYTASTWNENVRFISNGTYYSQYTYVFQADQRAEANYLKSDLLWAQAYMQTGSYNVHLSFNHVMACLKIQFDGGDLTDNAVVTVEGMPDIDQCEVVVGDYYAARSKVNSRFGYKEKCSCSKEENGKVLGVTVIRDDNNGRAVVYPFEESYIPNNATYTAHYDGGNYYLIVPPCTLSSAAKIWVRDGEKRYSFVLSDLTTFEQGKLHPVIITL